MYFVEASDVTKKVKKQRIIMTATLFVVVAIPMILLLMSRLSGYSLKNILIVLFFSIFASTISIILGGVYNYKSQIAEINNDQLEKINYISMHDVEFKKEIVSLVKVHKYISNHNYFKNGIDSLYEKIRSIELKKELV